MQIREIMTKEVETIQADTTLKDTAVKMRDLNVGFMPVTDGKSLDGIITDRDIVIRSTAEGDNPGEVTAGSIISKDVDWCYEDDEVETASARMKDKKIRRLPILNRDEELVGIVSLGDLAVEGEETKAGETLEEVSRPNRPEKTET